MIACPDGNVLAELLELLKLEKIEENIFRGQSQDLGFRSVYGGQVLGQALSAAYQTVPVERRAHSLHAYFLRPGDVERPIVYNVDPIRDGTSFTTRRVVAVQKGRAIFSMSASFQVDEPGFEHQDASPSVPGPDGIPSELEAAVRIEAQIPAPVRDKILCRRPIEVRPVNPMNPFAPERREPARNAWFKTIDRMPDDPRRARVPAGLRLRLRPRHDLALPPRPQLLGAGDAGRKPRPRHVVPPRFPHGRLAALRDAEPERLQGPGPRLSARSSRARGCWWPRWPRRG